MQDEKLTNRQMQARKTKNKIYVAAVKQMECNGYDNLKIEDICKSAQVSIGTFYHYYRSKEDVCHEILRNIDEYFHTYVANRLNQGNALEQIVEFFHYYAIHNKITSTGMLQTLVNFNNPKLSAKGRYIETLLLGIIRNGQARGEITAEISAEEIANYLLVLARGILFDWCLHNGAYDHEVFMQQFIRRLVYTFKK